MCSGSCGFWKRIRPVSSSGLTLTILQPLRAAFCNSRQHPRMIGARILADDEDRVGMLKILDPHRRFADAD